MSPDERMWPGIPAWLKYKDIRLPGTFRELVANRMYTDEEIGRIIRCIALETDFFLTPRIEAEVFYYREDQAKKKKASARVAEFRKRKRAELQIGDATARRVEKQPPPMRVTVTPKTAEADVRKDDSLFSTEKTPTNIVEKTPPIVPLEKSVSSSLEKTSQRKIRKTKRDRIADSLQQDLFSLVSDGSSDNKSATSTQMAQKGTVARSDGQGGKMDGQDIEIDSGAVHGSPDTRSEAAWIPERFAVFWSQYPRRIGKASAKKAFTKLIKSQKDVEKFMKTMISSLEWWKRQNSWIKDNGKFIPYPATWLNGGHWEDIMENKDGYGVNSAEFLNTSSESDAELIRRMQGGQ